MTVSVFAGVLKGRDINPVGEASVDMSERNLIILMDALGFVVTEHCGHIEINKFLNVARAWLQTHIGKPSAQIQSREHRGELGCRVIDLPVRAGYVNEQIHKIVTMLAHGKQQGATYVYWG